MKRIDLFLSEMEKDTVKGKTEKIFTCVRWTVLRGLSEQFSNDLEKWFQ